jgi:hypothetical protein
MGRGRELKRPGSVGALVGMARAAYRCVWWWCSRLWVAHVVAEEGVVVVGVGVVLGGRVTVVILGVRAVVAGVMVVDVGGV